MLILDYINFQTLLPYQLSHKIWFTLVKNTDFKPSFYCRQQLMVQDVGHTTGHQTINLELL
jgi:hypothetical protein